MIVYEYNQASVEHPERCEDAILVGSEADAAPLFAVIDGMGGHHHELANGTLLTGQDAAQAIRTVLIEDLEHFELTTSAESESDTELKVIEALNRANQHIFTNLNGGADTQLHQRVGAVATVVVICEGGKRLLVSQVGDTRAYVLTEGELIQICEDEDNI